MILCNLGKEMPWYHSKEIYNLRRTLMAHFLAIFILNLNATNLQIFNLQLRDNLGPYTKISMFRAI